MGDSTRSNTTPGAPQPENEKPRAEQKEFLSSEEKKENAPAMDIPGMGISAEAPKSPEAAEGAKEGQEPPTLDVPAGQGKEDVLEAARADGPKPPDLTPPAMPPPPAALAAETKEEKKKGYTVPPALGEFLGNQLKDLGLGGQIGLGGSLFCFLSSFFWSWPDVTGRVVWFAVLMMLLLSTEATALVCLHIPDKLSPHRGRMKDLLFVVAGHIVILSLLALLLGAKVGPVLSLIGGLAVCAGDYIWLVKSKRGES
ncbi:MAG: hypothetical protein AB1696_24340 [Planctomycetota bacterium]